MWTPERNQLYITSEHFVLHHLSSISTSQNRTSNEIMPVCTKWNCDGPMSGNVYSHWKKRVHSPFLYF